MLIITMFLIIKETLDLVSCCVDFVIKLHCTDNIMQLLHQIINMDKAACAAR